jgi:phytanoyl-CoA hydroxylase
MNSLSAEQLAQFQEDGFLIFETGFPSDALDAIQADIQAAVDSVAMNAVATGQLSEVYADAPFATRFSLLRRALPDPSPLQARVLGKSLKTAGMFRVMTEPFLLDAIESLLGPEILSHPQFNTQARLPHQEITEVPWHQDVAFLDPDALTVPMVNVWIPLVDTTIENGCLEVIAGSHRTGIHLHGMLPGYPNAGILEGHVPEGRAVACEVKRGGMVLFHNRMVHRCFPNRSAKIRWTLDIRYSNPDRPTGRAHVPGFVARSGAKPERVTRSDQEWRALFA